MNGRTGCNVRLHSLRDVLDGNLLHDHRALLAAALNEGDNWHLLVPRGFTALSFKLAAHIGFISFDHAREESSHRLALHSEADTVCHVPSSAIAAKAKVALQLQGADALLAAAHEVEGADPFAQRDVGIFKDSAHSDGELLFAGAAAMKAITAGFALHPVNHFACSFAMRAHSAIHPQQPLNISACLIFREIL